VKDPRISPLLVSFIARTGNLVNTTAKSPHVTKKVAAKAATFSTAKNKLKSPVPIFVAEKTTVSKPRSPRNPPQLHHKNTTLNQALSRKTPAKTPISPRRTFFYQLP
jgi:hypothetical protein